MLIVAHIIFFITKIIFFIRKVSQAMINQLVEVMHCYCLLDWPFCRYFWEFRVDGAFHNISQLKNLQWINVLKHQKMIWQIYVLAPLIREGGVFWVAIFFGKWKYCSWGRSWKITKGWLVNYLIVLIKIIAKWGNTFFL